MSSVTFSLQALATRDVAPSRYLRQKFWTAVSEKANSRSEFLKQCAVLAARLCGMKIYQVIAGF